MFVLDEGSILARAISDRASFGLPRTGSSLNLAGCVWSGELAINELSRTVEIGHASRMLGQDLIVLHRFGSPKKYR